MDRFQQWISDARAGMAPWERLPANDIQSIAHRLEAWDIADILADVARLSAEKNALAEWDGDSQDGVAAAQETLSQILAAAPEACSAEIAKGLESPDALTRAYVRIRLDGRKGPSPPRFWFSRLLGR